MRLKFYVRGLIPKSKRKVVLFHNQFFIGQKELPFVKLLGIDGYKILGIICDYRDIFTSFDVRFTDDGRELLARVQLSSTRPDVVAVKNLYSTETPILFLSFFHG